MSTVSEFASIMLLLTRWQSLAAENRSRKVKGLLVEAQKSSRLAKGIANIELAEELETISQDFQKEADDLAARLQAAAYAIYLSRLQPKIRPESLYFRQLLGVQLF
jgi:hypothetical protein